MNYNQPSNLFKITEKHDSLDQHTLYLQVILKKGPNFKPRKFPLLSSKNKDGIRMFENKDYKDILQDNSNEQIVSCPEDMCINEKSSFVTHVDL